MKKLLASLMALSMVFAVTGCSESKDSESEPKAETTTTTTTTVAKSESMAESEADTETTTTTAAPVESEADDTTTTADDATSTADEAEGTYENDVYTSALYSFKIDSKKWAMQESAGVDVMFTYTDVGDDAELASASINVISMSNDLLNGLTASDYADQIKTTYESMDGYTVTNDKEGKFAGKDAYIVDVTGEIGTEKVLLNQIITSDGGNLVVITYGASEAAYDKLSSEFQTVLDSFELK